MIRKQNPIKKEIKIRVSNLTQQNLRHLDTSEQGIELLKKT